MNRWLHSGAVALACLGILLAYAGWLGLKAPAGLACGDLTCEEAHP